ncbi:hypothetical protein ACTVZD_31795, partial [Pseudomonas aeruginosa]
DPLVLDNLIGEIRPASQRDALRGQGVLNSRMELGQSEVEGLHLNWLR